MPVRPRADARWQSSAYLCAMPSGNHNEHGSAVQPSRRDWAIALGLVAWGQIDLWILGDKFTQVPGSHAVAAPFLVLVALPLAWRRRWPLGVLCVSMGAAALEGFVVGSSPEGIDLLAPFLVGVYSVAAYEPLGRALLGFAFALIAGLLQGLQDPQVLTFGQLVIVDAAFALTLGGGVWLAGRYIRARRGEAERSELRADRVEREQEQRTREALADERGRIARELHDVIAHSVSLMGLQAGAAERVLEAEPERAREALRSIQLTARESVAELGRLLGVLRTDDGPAALSPQPGLDALSTLVQDSRVAGAPVDLTVEGAGRRLPPGVELSAYRVVQEALTNVRKHAPGAPSTVHVRYGDRQLDLRIENAAPATNRNGVEREPLPGSGHGLVGMRERISLYGGSLNAHAGPDGGFIVHAVLPIEATA